MNIYKVAGRENVPCKWCSALMNLDVEDGWEGLLHRNPSGVSCDKCGALNRLPYLLRLLNLKPSHYKRDPNENI